MKLVEGLLVINERIVLPGTWENGLFSLSLVGAMNVGSMSLNIEPTLDTNRISLRKDENEKVFEKKIGVVRGEEIGYFTLGSSVVLVFEAKDDFEFIIKPGEKVKVGQKIGMHKNMHRRTINEL